MVLHITPRSTLETIANAICLARADAIELSSNSGEAWADTLIVLRLDTVAFPPDTRVAQTVISDVEVFQCNKTHKLDQAVTLEAAGFDVAQ